MTMPSPLASPLSTDLYELNMVQAYLDHGETAEAVFEFFVRKLPERRGFLMAAGLDTALVYLESLRFGSDDIAWLRSSGRFRPNLIDYLASFAFTGDVHGTVFFPNEPIIRITAPLPQAQLIESLIINIMHFQTLVASKAARMVLMAEGKLLSDFGLRSAHGSEAGLLSARASFIAGFGGAANVEAGKRFGVPVVGTMAHAFVQIHDDEATAFEHYARSRPDGVILLIDTFDTEAGARKVVALAPKLKADGIAIRGVRIDSGDLIAMSRKVRAILDAGGLTDTMIVVSGGVDEDFIRKARGAGAPIDGFGVGASLDASSDVPVLECAYKLQEYRGRARRKLSEGKVTWPGRKQVWRETAANGRMAGDVLTIDGDRQQGTPLIVPVMKGGRRLYPAPSLGDVRAHAAGELGRLPEHLRRLESGVPYPVAISDALDDLAKRTVR